MGHLHKKPNAILWNVRIRQYSMLFFHFWCFGNVSNTSFGVMSLGPSVYLWHYSLPVLAMHARSLHPFWSAIPGTPINFRSIFCSLSLCISPHDNRKTFMSLSLTSIPNEPMSLWKSFVNLSSHWQSPGVVASNWIYTIHVGSSLNR